jgi:hypothetical protein
MEFVIPNTVTGFKDYHILARGENQPVSFVKEIPSNIPLIINSKEFDEIARIYNLSIPSFPSIAQRKALEAVLPSSSNVMVPWYQVMPSGAFKVALRGFVNDLAKQLDGLDLSYYNNHYTKTLKVFEKLQRAKINKMAWHYHNSDKDTDNRHVLASFSPQEDGFAEQVVYSKSMSKTGRMIVISGPDILTLAKKKRNILSSRFGKDGKIIQLDFRALEPRVLLYLSPAPSIGYVPQPQEDLYQEVLETLGVENILRDDAKKVILSQIYGFSYEKLLEKLSEVRDPGGFINLVNDYFQVDAIKENLRKEYEANNKTHILSCYGRPINTLTAQLYMLLNYYVQSSSVDVAMHGFCNIVEEIDDDEKIIPIFVNHDALVLDVHNSAIDKLKGIKEVGTTNIPLFSNRKFPIKLDRFV